MALARARSRPMSPPPWSWTWAGILTGVLLCGLWLPPARWLAQLLASVSAGHVQLRHPSGTLWQGSAELVLTGGAGSRDAVRLPQRVQWQLQPGWGQLRLTVQAPCCTPAPLTLRLSPAWPGLKLSLAANQSHWPAGLLSGLGAPWNTLALDGRLTLSHSTLQALLTPQQLQLDGELTLDADDLSSHLSTLRPLGSYRITLHGGSQPALALSSRAGPLRLDGQGQWQGARLRFDGVATAEPAHAAELANLLNIIGRREGERSVITLAL